MKAYLTVLFATASVAFADVRYTVVPLVPSSLEIGNAIARGINQFGDAAGVFLGPLQENHGFIYTDGRGFFQLDGAGGNLFPTGINNSGQLAAYDGMGTTYPVRYTPGLGFENLGTFGGRENETASINNLGQVVGFSSRLDGNQRAFRYTDGIGLEDLGTLPGAQYSVAHGINDAGWVTGGSGGRAFLYTDEGGMVDLGPGTGLAINEAGVIVGQNGGMAVLYLSGTTRFLWGAGAAMAINNLNVVVGAAFPVTGGIQAGIWSEVAGYQDLNALIDSTSGWYLASATGINDAGQIVGWGYSPERGGLQTPFRLDPIPEPSIWALLLLGGGLLALSRRSRA
jgi:probable HAF family extracellular repeat protein